MTRHITRVLTLLLLAIMALRGASFAQQLPPGETPPPTIAEKIANAGSAEDFDDADYLIVEDITINRVKGTGVAETEQTMLYKILTAEGCKSLSVLTWNYLPLTRWVKVEEISVIRGEEVISVNLNMLKETTAPQGGIYWGDRLIMATLPRLQVGDGIFTKVYQKGFSYALLKEHPEAPADVSYIPPMRGEYFDIITFNASAPTLLKKYALTLPADKRLHAEVYNGELFSSLRYTDEDATYSWWAKDIIPREYERYAADAEDVVSKVVLSTAKDWEAKSRWFFQVNRNQFEPTPEIRIKVKEILAEAGVSKGSEEQQAKALLHWVANNIRYSGQTMGQGEGFTLHSGEMVFKQRSGVCKDIASMLVVMMRAAGMDSYAAMTFAGARIEDLPADQFNHSVTALRKADGSFVMYDPTWAPNSMTIWSMYEAEQHFVIGTEDGEKLMRIAYSPPEDSPLRVKSSGEFDEQGNFSGKLEFQSAGAMDSRLRGMVVGSRIRDREQNIGKVLAAINPRAELTSFEHGDIADFNKGMWFKISYTIPAYAMTIGDGIEWQSPMMKLLTKERWFLRVGDHDWEEEREGDLFVWFTQLLEGDESLKLPKGYDLQDIDQPEQVDETYAFFSGSVLQDKRNVKLNNRVEIRRRQIPLAGYAGFREAVNGVQDFAKVVYRAEKGGAK